MKQVILTTILFFTSALALAYDKSDLQGKWLVESFQIKMTGESHKGDGTDFWEFKDTKYIVYSLGMEMSTTEFVVQDDILVIKAILGDSPLTILELSDKNMKVSDKSYIYSLVKQ